MLNSQQAIMTSKEKYLKLERSDLDQPFPSAALMTCDTGRTVTGVSPWCSATAPGPPGRPPGGWSLPSGGLRIKPATAARGMCAKTRAKPGGDGHRNEGQRFCRFYTQWQAKRL